MIKICIIGFGNVAQHLITAFSEVREIQLVQILVRQVPDNKLSIPQGIFETDYSKILDADIYIIAVKDDAIDEVSNQLNFRNKLVVHTSGGKSIDVINTNNRRGVFYPLQTFTKGKAVNFKAIPICIEADNAEDQNSLHQLASTISDHVYSINSEQRKALHVAAVFVNNFVNHMLVLGEEICNDYQISFDVLKPLIQETVEKIQKIHPKVAQTGPAIREDSSTIEAHLQFIKDENKKNIYQILTQSIQNHVKKL